MRAVELGLFAGIVAAGSLLRLVHAGAPSLWWDELVHVRTAELPRLADVLREVKQGIPPGYGNAGAVPLDYVLLHAWLRAAPAPVAANLERHYRAPALLYSCLALVAMWGFCRSIFGLPVAAVATALLALSLPHVLYAAEARFYSLFVLVTIGNLWAFAWLLAAPASIRRWLVWLAVSIAWVATGLYGLFLLAAEFVVLGALGIRSGRRAVVPLLASGLLVAVLVAVYFAPTAVALVYPRAYPAGLRAGGAVLDTAWFFALDGHLLAWVFLLGLPVAVIDAAVGSRRRLPFLIALALGVLAIPATVEIARWKHYYFHPRHVLFLLPGVLVATALALVAVLGRLVRGRPGWTTALGLLVVVALAGPSVYRFLRDPMAFFSLVKIDRDYRGFVQDLAGRLSRVQPGMRHVVLAERNRPGYLGNPLLDLYLRAYGLEDRVLLRGFSDPGTVPRLATTCPDGCRGRHDVQLESALNVGDPFGQAPAMRQLIGLGEPMGTWPADVDGVSLVLYNAFFGDDPVPGLRRRAYRGFSVFEPPG